MSESKGYVVRGTTSDGQREVLVFRFHHVEPKFTAALTREEAEKHPDMGTRLFATLPEAIEAYRAMGHLRDVRIYAVAADGTETPLLTYEEALAIVDLARRLIRSSDLHATAGGSAKLTCDEEPYGALLSLFEAEREVERTIPGLVCVECGGKIYRGSKYAGRPRDTAHWACRNWPKETAFKVAGEGSGEA